MSLQFNIETRNERNDLVWSHGLFIPKVSKEFISELRTILTSRLDDSNRVLNSCSTTTDIQYPVGGIKYENN